MVECKLGLYGLAQNEDQLRSGGRFTGHGNARLGSIKVGNFLTSVPTVSLSRIIPLHGIRNVEFSRINNIL
jgi:hypothetical protein